MSSNKVSKMFAEDWQKQPSTKDWWASVEPCLLPKEVQKVASQELRENENARNQSLVAFQQWVSKNPDVQNINTGMIKSAKFCLRVKNTFKRSIA